MGENDAEYYDEEIRHFELNSEDTAELLKQVHVITSNLGALKMLAYVARNYKQIKLGLIEIQTYLDYLKRPPVNYL